MLKLLIAILPIIVICMYIYRNDKEKESKKLLIKLFIMGVFSCIPAAILETIVDYSFNMSRDDMNLFILLIYSIICIALVEELCKWFLVYNITYFNEEFNNIYDALVYSIFVSLGFAFFENILYVYAEGIGIGILRAITSVPGHACNAIVMGNFLGIAKKYNISNEDKLERKYLLLSILMPIITHGLYDYFALSNNLLYYFLFISFIILMYIYSLKKIKKLSVIGDYINT